MVASLLARIAGGRAGAGLFTEAGSLVRKSSSFIDKIFPGNSRDKIRHQPIVVPSESKFFPRQLESSSNSFNNDRSEKYLENILLTLKSIDKVSKTNLTISTKMLELQTEANKLEKERKSEQPKPQQTNQQPSEEKESILNQIPMEVLGIGGLMAISSIAGLVSHIAPKPKNRYQRKEKMISTDQTANLKGYATGGKIKGNPDLETDNILARVEEGEFITKRSAVPQNQTLLEEMNSGGFNILKQREKEAVITGKIIGDKLTKTFEDIFRKQRVDSGMFFSDMLNKLKEKLSFATSGDKEKPKTSQFGRFAANTLMSFMGKSNNKDNALSNLIAKVESAGDPNVYRKDGQAVRGANLQNMTIDEMLKLEGSVYGKYQGQKQWILTQAKEMGIDTSKTKFTEDIQDKMANNEIMRMKTVQAAMKDPSEQNIRAAMTEISSVWRGLPDPRTGATYGDQYAKFNKAGVGVDEYRNAFMQFLQPQNKSPLDNLMSGMKTAGQFLEQNMLTRERAGRTPPPAAVQPVVVAGGGAPPKPSYRNVGGPIPNINGPRVLEAISQFGSVFTVR